MVSRQSLCNTGLWIAALGVILSLQVADAQTIAPGLVVPGWGIALLVLMSIIFVIILICVCCLPLCCRANGTGSEGGMGSFMDRLAFWK